MRESMKMLNPALAKVLKRLHYPLEVILTCVRWYVAYPLSLRHLEEMMAERGISVDHSTVHRWAIKVLPVLATGCRFFSAPYLAGRRTWQGFSQIRTDRVESCRFDGKYDAKSATAGDSNAVEQRAVRAIYLAAPDQGQPRPDDDAQFSRDLQLHF